MSFVYPWVLVLLFLVLFFYGAKKSSKIEQVFSKEILQKLQINSVKVFGKNIRFYLLVISFVCMVFALARPVVVTDKMSQIDVKSFNLVIALDISRSMKANDVFPNRIDYAKKAIYDLMDKIPEANIAVIAFTNDAFLVSPFSNDFKSIKFLLSNLDTNSLSSKGSQILSALSAAKKVYESTQDKKKAVLLVSDGADGRNIDKISEYIKENRFVLHVLNIGTKKGSTLNNDNGGLVKDKQGNIVISKRDDSVAKIASMSGGAFLSSTGSLSKLDWLSKEIKSSVDKKEVKRDKFEGAQELFYYPLILCVVLLFFVFNSPRIPLMMLLLVLHVDSKAGMFDFIDIHKANTSYKNKEYQKADEYFSKIGSDSAKYDKANALYKQKKFKEALTTYKSIENFKNEQEFKRLHNIGNSYANLGKIDEAIKSYEKALKLKNDEDTQANLELMKKKKQQQKKKQDNKNNKKKKDNQKNKDKKKEKKQNKQQNKDKKNKDDKKSEKQKKRNKENEKKQNKKSEQKNSKVQKKKTKKMSEEEAKKWEKRMNENKFKTQPMKLKKGEQNEISW
ncbi:VWA domain-containing protein [Sulfurospirillum arcachonense]|uniref:VWA domain-containing protein n=1 Tax=Sulfurospirillum arcachonense TaxID=57666 RepID=UPI0004691B11|nr:VWA domain-containing protein [Sulfurospirillum arcachonense]